MPATGPTTSSKQLRKKPMIDELEDNALLQEIAVKKDHDAFQKLYVRYECYAFSIALRILGKRSLAEEAVQEAFLGIWSSASCYCPDKNHHPRHWIMRIIVNNCLRLEQAQQRRERNAKREADLSCERVPSNATEGLEKSELLGALHQKLSHLPAESRLILTLFYGVGMSQKEIAETVSMPPRTVSFKIQETLKWLRGELVKAKFGGVVPALSAEIMRAACSDGYQPSPELQERVFEHLARKANAPSAAQIEGTFPKAPVFAAFGLIAALSIAIGVYAFTEKPTQTATPSKQTVSMQPKLLQRWDFNQPDLSGLNQMSGTWNHLSHSGPDGSGCMSIEGHSPMDIGIRIPLDKLPLRLQFKAIFKSNKHTHMISWPRQIPHVALRRFQSDKVKPTKETWKSFQCYVSKQGFEFRQNDRRVTFHLFNVTPQSELRLSLQTGTMIDDLELYQVDSTILKDSEPYIQAAKKYAADQHGMPMLIPTLCSGPTRTHPQGQIWKASSRRFPKFTGTKTQIWKFKSPDDLLDFAVIKGNWKHVPNGGKNGTGCVNFSKGNSTAIFNLKAEQFPFLITARFKVFDSGTGFPIFKWRPNSSPIQAYFINAYPDPKININPAKPWIKIKLYVTREYCDYWAQNRRITLMYNSKNSGALGSIVSKGATQMDYLSIRPIRPELVPNLGPFKAAIEKIRTAKKSYILPLPHFKSPTPGKKVFVEIRLE